MANRIVLRLLPFLGLLLVSCGGGGTNSQAPGPGGGAAPIDPSGNWTMTASDSGGASAQFAALFAQTGAVVTANSITPAGDPAPFACVPFKAALSGGLVQNVSNFVGSIDISNSSTGSDFGTFSFTATLADDGKSFTGTYSNMPPCAGVLSSGTFTGAEVPTASGNWTGTLQPCALDQTTGDCPVFGATSPITATLTQNDVTGNVTGTYQANGADGLTTGTISVVPPSDILSGHCFQFTELDAGGIKFVTNGGCNGTSGLDLKGNFVGIVSDVFRPGIQNFYLLTASH